MVGPAPGWKRVEFSPAGIRQAMEAGPLEEEGPVLVEEGRIFTRRDVVRGEGAWWTEER